MVSHAPLPSVPMGCQQTSGHPAKRAPSYVEVPHDRVVEFIVERIVEVPVEKIVEVQYDRIVEKINSVPVQKIVERPVEVPARGGAGASGRETRHHARTPQLSPSLCEADSSRCSSKAIHTPQLFQNVRMVAFGRG